MLLNRARTYFNKAIKSRIGRETISSLILKLVSVGLAFLSTAILARILGPADYGIYSYVIAIVTLLTVPSEFGLPALIIRETASGMAREDYSAVQGVWVWSVRTTGIISISLVGLSAIVILFFRQIMAGTRLETFIWGLALVPLIALGDLRGAALRGLKRIVSGQLPEFLLRPGIFVLLLLGVMLIGGGNFSAPNSMVLYVIASALAFTIGAWLLWRATPELVRHAKPRIENRSWLISALPLAFIGGMNIINSQASILLQGFFLKDADIGIFRVATQVSLLASFGLLAVNQVVVPRFAEIFALGEKTKLQRLVTASSRVILFFNLAITIGFVVLGKLFLRKIFGSSYEAAYIPLMILLGGQLINSGVGSVGNLLNMSHHERDSAMGLAVAVVLNIIINLLLLPIWGIIGSSIAKVISMVSWNMMLWWIVYRKLGINCLAFYKIQKVIDSH
ncbi:MAG: oligosaccharide flippase family protein [Chloroflexota bacterium]